MATPAQGSSIATVPLLPVMDQIPQPSTNAVVSDRRLPKYNILIIGGDKNAKKWK